MQIGDAAVRHNASNQTQIQALGVPRNRLRLNLSFIFSREAPASGRPYSSLAAVAPAVLVAVVATAPSPKALV